MSFEKFSPSLSPFRAYGWFKVDFDLLIQVEHVKYTDWSCNGYSLILGIPHMALNVSRLIKAIKSPVSKEREEAIEQLYASISSSSTESVYALLNDNGDEVLLSLTGLVERGLPELRVKVDPGITSELVRKRYSVKFERITRCIHYCIHVFNPRVALDVNFLDHFIKVFSGVDLPEWVELQKKSQKGEFWELEIFPIKQITGEYLKLLQDLLNCPEIFSYIEHRPNYTVPLLCTLLAFAANDMKVHSESSQTEDCDFDSEIPPTFTPLGFVSADAPFLGDCLAKLTRASLRQNLFPYRLFIRNCTLALRLTLREPTLWASLLESLTLVILERKPPSYCTWEHYMPHMLNFMLKWWVKRKPTLSFNSPSKFQWPIYHFLVIFRYSLAYCVGLLRKAGTGPSFKVGVCLSSQLLEFSEMLVQSLSDSLLKKDGFLPVSAKDLPRVVGDNWRTSIGERYFCENQLWLSYNLTHLLANFYLLAQYFLLTETHLTAEDLNSGSKRRKVGASVVPSVKIVRRPVLIQHMQTFKDRKILMQFILHAASLVLLFSEDDRIFDLCNAIVDEVFARVESLQEPSREEVKVVLSIIAEALGSSAVSLQKQRFFATRMTKLISKHPTTLLLERKVWSCLASVPISLLEEKVLDCALPHIMSFFAQVWDMPSSDSVDFLLHLARNKSLLHFKLLPSVLLNWLGSIFESIENMKLLGASRSSFAELFFVLLAYDNHSFFSYSFSTLMVEGPMYYETLPCAAIAEAKHHNSLGLAHFNSSGCVSLDGLPSALAIQLQRVNQRSCNYESLQLDLSKAKLDAVTELFERHLGTFFQENLHSDPNYAKLQVEVMQGFLLSELIKFSQANFGVQLDDLNPLTRIFKKFFDAFLTKISSAVMRMGRVSPGSDLVLSLARMAAFLDKHLSVSTNLHLLNFLKVVFQMIERGLCDFVQSHSAPRARKTCGHLSDPQKRASSLLSFEKDPEPNSQDLSFSISSTDPQNLVSQSAGFSSGRKPQRQGTIEEREAANDELSFNKLKRRPSPQQERDSALILSEHRDSSNFSALTVARESDTQTATHLLHDNSVSAHMEFPLRSSVSNSGSNFRPKLINNGRESNSAAQGRVHVSKIGNVTLFDSLFLLYFPSGDVLEPSAVYLAQVHSTLARRFPKPARKDQPKVLSDVQYLRHFERQSNSIFSGISWPPGCNQGLLAFYFMLYSKFTVLPKPLELVFPNKQAPREVVDSAARYFNKLTNGAVDVADCEDELQWIFFILGSLLSSINFDNGRTSTACICFLQDCFGPLERIATHPALEGSLSRPLALLHFCFLTAFSVSYPKATCAQWKSCLKRLLLNYDAGFEVAYLLCATWPYRYHTNDHAASFCGCAVEILGKRGLGITKTLLPTLVVIMNRVNDSAVGALCHNILWKILYDSQLRGHETQWAKNCIGTWAGLQMVSKAATNDQAEKWLLRVFQSSPVLIISTWLSAVCDLNFDKLSPGANLDAERRHLSDADLGLDSLTACAVVNLSKKATGKVDLFESCTRNYEGPLDADPVASASSATKSLSAVLHKQTRNFFVANGKHIFTACLLNDCLACCEDLLKRYNGGDYNRKSWFHANFAAIISELTSNQFKGLSSLPAALHEFFSSEEEYQAKFCAFQTSTIAHCLFKSHSIPLETLLVTLDDTLPLSCGFKYCERDVGEVPKALERVFAMCKVAETGHFTPKTKCPGSPLKVFGQVQQVEFGHESSRAETSSEQIMLRNEPPQPNEFKSSILAVFTEILAMVSNATLLESSLENVLTLFVPYLGECWIYVKDNFLAVKCALLIAKELCRNAGESLIPMCSMFVRKLYMLVCEESKENAKLYFSAFYHVILDLLLNDYLFSSHRSHLLALLKFVVLESENVREARMAGVFLVQFGRLFHPSLAPLAFQLPSKFSLQLVEGDCRALFLGEHHSMTLYYSPGLIGPLLYILHHFLKQVSSQNCGSSSLADVARSLPVAYLIRLVSKFRLPQTSVSALKVQLGCIVGLLVPHLTSPQKAVGLQQFSLPRPGELEPSTNLSSFFCVSSRPLCKCAHLFDADVLDHSPGVAVLDGKEYFFSMILEVCQSGLETLDSRLLRQCCASLDRLAALKIILKFKDPSQAGSCLGMMQQSLQQLKGHVIKLDLEDEFTNATDLDEIVDELELHVSNPKVAGPLDTDRWLRRLCVVLVANTKVAELSALVPAIGVSFLFAQAWYPMLCYWALNLKAVKDRHKKLLERIYALVFKNWRVFSSTLVQTLVQSLLLLRTKKIKDPQVSFDQNFWINVNYVDASKACLHHNLIYEAQLFLEVGWAASFECWEDFSLERESELKELRSLQRRLSSLISDAKMEVVVLGTGGETAGALNFEDVDTEQTGVTLNFEAGNSSESDAFHELEQRELELQQDLDSSEHGRTLFKFLRSSVASGFSFVGRLVNEQIFQSYRRLPEYFTDIYHESLWKMGLWDEPTISTSMAAVSPVAASRPAVCGSLNTLLFDYFRQMLHQDSSLHSYDAPLYGQLISWLSIILHKWGNSSMARQSTFLNDKLWPFTIALNDPTPLYLENVSSSFLDVHTAKILCGSAFKFKQECSSSSRLRPHYSPSLGDLQDSNDCRAEVGTTQLRQVFTSLHFKRAIQFSRRRREWHKSARYLNLWKFFLQQYESLSSNFFQLEAACDFEIERGKFLFQKGEKSAAILSLRKFCHRITQGQFGEVRYASAVDSQELAESDFEDSQGLALASYRKKITGRVLLKLGLYLAETRQERPKKIIEDYFLECLNCLQSFGSLKLVGKAHFELARYADTLFELGQGDNHSALRCSMIQEMWTRFKSIYAQSRACRDKDECNELRRECGKLEKSLRFNVGEQIEYFGMQSELLQLALNHYLSGLAVSSLQSLKSDQKAVFRFVQLCVMYTGLDDIYLSLQDRILKVPAFKFLPVLFQLVGRLNVNESNQFQMLLRLLIERVAVEHPLQALPPLIALASGPGSPSVWYQKQCDASPAAKAAIKLLARVSERIKPKYGDLYEAFLLATEDYIRLAEVKVPAQVQGKRSKRFSTRKPYFQFPQLVNVPVLTRKVEAEPLGAYDMQQIVRIHEIKAEMELVGGINAPKKCYCVGSDGRVYPQLVKGRDDLRQDAVLSSIFAVLNSLFERDSRSRELLLSMEVYRVIPLSSQAGVVEWLDDTVTLGSWLHAAHPMYRPQDMSLGDARKKMAHEQSRQQSSLESKLGVFTLICSRLKPVFRHFFWERFPDPATWLRQRQAYTKSLAVASIAGYVVGLGDRHADNFLIGSSSARIVHIDLGIAFDHGRLLVMPEWVPFRLTRDMVDGMGPLGTVGLFQTACEQALELFRREQAMVATLVGVFLYEPLLQWSNSRFGRKGDHPIKAPNSLAEEAVANRGERRSAVERAEQRTVYGRMTALNGGFLVELERQISWLMQVHESWTIETLKAVNKDAKSALLGIQRKLASHLSVTAHVLELISSAQDPERLCRMYHGWQPWL